MASVRVLTSRTLAGTFWPAASAQCTARLLSSGSQGGAGKQPADVDAFTAHLQSKTEQELLNLLQQRHEQPARFQTPDADGDAPAAGSKPAQPPGEEEGPRGPEPTRYGDWERGGRCYDF